MVSIEEGKREFHPIQMPHRFEPSQRKVHENEEAVDGYSTISINTMVLSYDDRPQATPQFQMSITTMILYCYNIESKVYKVNFSIMYL